MRRLLGAALLAAGVGAAAPAHAVYETNDFFAAALAVTASLDRDGLGVALGIHLSWTRVDAPLPLGADVELTWLFARSELRAATTAHVVPAALLPGDDCSRRVTTRARDESLAFGPSLAVGGGPALQFGGGAPDWGAQLGVSLAGAIFTSHARALWLADRGPVAELGGGLRAPSLLGFDDVGLVCP